MIEIVLADDSKFFRDILKEKIESFGKIKVVGVARNGVEAVELVQKLKPDILILDCQMPVMDGLECLKKIQKECPLPVFMLSSFTREGSEVTIKALEYGAIDFLPKPTGGVLGIDRTVGALVQKIEVIIMQRNLRRIHGKYQSLTRDRKEKETSFQKWKSRNIDLVAIGSSIGGIQSAMDIIPRLPAHMKPVVWVQHLPEGFSESLAQRFDASSKMRVKLAENDEVIKQGTCYIAPAGLQTRVEYSSGRSTLKVQGQQRVSSHCPSCDVLFGSVAECYTENAVGVILSGMGDDGTVGLKKMHQKGAFVIGEEEESCVVYGMPKMAMARGAVDIEMDSGDIAEAILKIAGYES